jgi:hypothetical protein
LPLAHDLRVRTLGRVRWLLPAVAVPVAVTALGLGVQALAFEKPAAGTLFATEALRELVRFHAMAASERLPTGRVRSLCVEGWFHARDRRRLHRGALVLLSDGTRMYDLGHGIRSWDGIPAGPLNRRRFLLAGCPRAFDERLAAALVHGAGVTVTRTRDGRVAAYELRVAKARMGLIVAATTLRPVGVLIGTESSVLTSLPAAVALDVVQRAFGLRPPARRSGV